MKKKCQLAHSPTSLWLPLGNRLALANSVRIMVESSIGFTERRDLKGASGDDGER